MKTIISNKDQYIDAVNRLKVYDYAYWVLNAPTISDADYDDLYIGVQDYEKRFPEEVLTDSPTQTTDENRNNGNGRRVVARRTPMLSTEKANDPAKVLAWMAARRKKLGDCSFVAEWKYDGDSCSLVYVDGRLVQASYGKGEHGADCLEHVLLIPSIPKHIPVLGRVEVRGEVVCPFDKLAQTRYKTCRSAASAYLAADRPEELFASMMSFYPYYIEADNANLRSAFARQADVIPYLGHYLGFNAVVLAPFGSIDEKFLEHVADERKKLGIPVDGIVIKVNERALWEGLGRTEHHPKYSLAYKFPPVQVVAHLLRIERTVGKTGKVTPVAILASAEINGIVVCKASLGSEKCMRDLGLDWNSTDCDVLLGLANDVIPHIYGTK